MDKSSFSDPSTSKKDDDENDTLYCICRTKYNSKKKEFMIACEKCQEWFHGRCIKMTEQFAKNIDLYYCNKCAKEYNFPQIVFRPEYKRELDRIKREKNESGCFRTDKCEKCSQCLKDPPGLCLSLRCVQYNVPKTPLGRPRRETVKATDDDDFEKPVPRTARATNSPEKSKRGRKKGWKKDQQANSSASHQEPQEKAKVPRVPELERALAHFAYESYSGRRRVAKKNVKNDVDAPRQCLEPNCIKEARETSKYCSDQCGLTLAKTRLTMILPGRVEEFWKVRPCAEARNNMWLDELNEMCDHINKTIAQLLDYYQMVVRYVNALQNVDPMEEEEDSNHETMAHCTVCGIEVNSRQLAKHVERCFVRSEKQNTFGAHQMAPYNPNELFCETFNKISKIYCKRLRVMCAEHYKGDLEATMKVCGCPKMWSANNMKSFTDIFIGEGELLHGGFCTSPRKECSAHHRWIQTVLGIIEGERMNLLTKYEELNEKRMSISFANSNRGDAITMLCCETSEVSTE